MDHILELTPSEFELLKSNVGNEKILFGNLTRQLADEKSSLLSLLEQIFIKALEANQAAGNFICLVQDDRSILGIKSRKRLVIRVNGSHYHWPEPSLEASLDSLVRRLSGGEGVLPIADVVCAWLGEGAINHIQAGLRWIFEALVERGWLRRTVEQRLDLFRLTSYEIPARTRSVLDQSPQLIDPALGLNQAWSLTAPAIIARELEKELHRLSLRSQ